VIKVDGRTIRKFTAGFTSDDIAKVAAAQAQELSPDHNKIEIVVQRTRR